MFPAVGILPPVLIAPPVLTIVYIISLYKNYFIVQFYIMNNYRKLNSYALSGDDIKKILGRDVKIIKYPDFGNVDNIFDALNNNECIVFFETVSQMVGHWDCIFSIQDTYYKHYYH
jgi:hypothetical protein